MADNPHHEHLIRELTEQLKLVFDNSPQAIYLYLDDEHKSCNKKFSEMLGYSSPEEWVKNQFPVSDIIEKDQDKGIKAYTDASQNYKASSLAATWITKKGEKIKTMVTMVPVSYKDEVFVLHFIERE